MGDAFDDLLESLDNLQPKQTGETSYEAPAESSYDAGGYSDGTYEAPVETPVAYDEPPSIPVEEPLLVDSGDQRETATFSSVAPPAPPPVQRAPAYRAPPPSSAPSYGGGGGGGNACGKCGQVVGGEHIRAMERVWHVQHFTCERCRKELRGGAFFVHDGQPHCTSCVESLNPCSKCNRGITGQYMYSPHGEKWHMECVDRRTCAKCHGAISETEISALGQHWHPHCFVCEQCRAQLSGSFVVKDGRPLCQNCSHASRVLCQRCNQAITGEYVTFKGENLHNHCHTCAYCRKPLGVSGFYEVQGQPRCQDCLNR